MKKSFYKVTLVAALIALPLALFAFSANLVKAQAQAQNRVQQAEPIKAEIQTREKTSAQVQAQNMDGQDAIQERAQVMAGDENATTTPGQKKTGLENAETRRSQVANAVQAMLAVADRDGGIGEQVRTIAQEQEKNFEDVEAGLEKVQNRDKFIRFLLGADYKEIKKAKDLLEQADNGVKELTRLRDQVRDSVDQAAMQEQLQTLSQIRDQVQAKLDEAQKGFSLFGWLARLFN